MYRFVMSGSTWEEGYHMLTTHVIFGGGGGGALLIMIATRVYPQDNSIIQFVGLFQKIVVRTNLTIYIYIFIFWSNIV